MLLAALLFLPIGALGILSTGIVFPYASGRRVDQGVERFGELVDTEPPWPVRQRLHPWKLACEPATTEGGPVAEQDEHLAVVGVERDRRVGEFRLARMPHDPVRAVAARPAAMKPTGPLPRARVVLNVGGHELVAAQPEPV